MPRGTESISSPLSFTYPLNYVPHPLCVAAAEEVMAAGPYTDEGKMFGVLIVDVDGERKYLKAFSGIMNGTYFHDGFVPPIFNLQDPDGYFKQEEARISAINKEIEALKAEELNAQSLRNVRESDNIVTSIQETDVASRLENALILRKERSHALQNWLFSQYKLLNAKGETRTVTDIFKDQRSPITPEDYMAWKTGKLKHKPKMAVGMPPAGTGECCLPKLLQCAYTHNLKPLCMAEFWMGPSPKDELRAHGNYYPSCHAKCKPLLPHILQGLVVDPDPMIQRNLKMVSEVKYLYEDSDIVVCVKPSGLLSAPGKDTEQPSLLQIIRQRHPEAEGPILPHRLDQDTSGLIVAALNTRCYHNLQEQFSRHTAKKMYVAVLDREVTSGEQGTPPEEQISKSGTIDLPLCPNAFDRPRQMVSHEHGKRAITGYDIIELSPAHIRVNFYPETGRTHQLRVHAAHPDGLGCPIKGDNLYGKPSDRLYLHATSLEFVHPMTGQTLTFISSPDF